MARYIVVPLFLKKCMIITIIVLIIVLVNNAVTLLGFLKSNLLPCIEKNNSLVLLKSIEFL